MLLSGKFCVLHYVISFQTHILSSIAVTYWTFVVPPGAAAEGIDWTLVRTPMEDLISKIISSVRFAGLFAGHSPAKCHARMPRKKKLVLGAPNKSKLWLAYSSQLFRLHSSPPATIQHFLWQLWQPLLQLVPFGCTTCSLPTLFSQIFFWVSQCHSIFRKTLLNEFFSSKYYHVGEGILDLSTRSGLPVWT